MQLPPRIREAIERRLEGIPLGDLQQASQSLSERYRAANAAKIPHLSSSLLASAYLTVRFPATFAAIRRAMKEVARVAPQFAPRTQMDAGSGPGTATLAAREVWPGLEQALLLESSVSIQQAGEMLLKETGLSVEWISKDLATAMATGTHDLVTCAYVLSELAAEIRLPVLERLWTATAGVLLLVEPGTPAGWERILEARSWLLSAGGQILAPCPHGMECPLASPDWCHFVERVERSRMHRLVKQGEVPWEDEKFLYMAVTREHIATTASPRVLTRPEHGKGWVQLKLCQADGTTAVQTIRKRQEEYKSARKAGWGDLLESDT